MPEPPCTGDAVLELVRKSELADDDALNGFLQQSGPIPPTAAAAAARLVSAAVLTPYQAKAILRGKYKGFRLGPYRILDKLGAGGMGQVFLAEHAHMHRRVALKVLPSRHANDKASVERFYREARASAALDHPNVVHAYDVASDKGTHFLVLEYVEGQSLADRLSEAGGVLSVSEACAYVVQVAAGLQHAHEKGLAHRDIKPGNLVVDREGIVKILDMGLARFFADADGLLTRRHAPGSVMGTADYVAPEQLLDSSTADHRADIYSLGATLYHFVAGRPPFDGTTTAKLIAHQLHAVPPAHSVKADVPEKVSAVIERMMAKDPADRYQSAAEMVVELLPFVCTTGPAGMPSGKLPPIAAAVVSQSTANLRALTDHDEQDTRLARSRKRRVALAGAFVGVAIAGAAASFLLNGGSNGSDAKPAEVRPDARPDPEHHTLTPHLPRLLALLTGSGAALEDVVFTADGNRVVAAVNPGKHLVVWDAVTGVEARRVKLPDGVRGCRGLAGLPGDRLVSCFSSDPVVRVWDLGTGEEVRRLTAARANGFVSVATLPDGCVLATATDRSVRLWNPDVDEAAIRYDIGAFGRGLAITPDGQRFVVGCDDKTARLWSVAGKTEIRSLPLNAVPWRIAISPDGNWAAFGNGNVVQLWNLDTDEPRVLDGPTGYVDGVTFNRNGRFVIASSADRGLHSWEFATGRYLGKVMGHEKPLRAVSLSPLGVLIATSSTDGRALVWQLPESMTK